MIDLILINQSQFNPEMIDTYVGTNQRQLSATLLEIIYIPYTFRLF